LEDAEQLDSSFLPFLFDTHNHMSVISLGLLGIIYLFFACN
jgi:hypothetical protein